MIKGVFAVVCVASLVQLYSPGYFLNRSSEYAVCSDQSIYTVEVANPVADCILVKQDRIAGFDQLSNVQKPDSGIIRRIYNGLVGGRHVYQLKPGSIIAPGFADAHAHVIEYGWKMQLVLDGSNSIEEVTQRVESYILSHPDILKDPTRWIEGMGWDQTKWPGSEFPTAANLDTVPLLRNRPIFLNRIDGHAAWVSPRVLEIMGNLPETVDGGKIVRDIDGEPTGVFVDNAMSLIPRPSWSEPQMSDFYKTAMQHALAHGLTSIHDAMATPEMIKFVMKRAQEGALPLRLYLMGHIPSSQYWGSKIPRLINYGKHGRLTCRSVKLVADGALGSWGAALLKPYSDKPDASGLLLTPVDELRSLVRQFYSDKWQVNVHCIGDRANDVVLDIFEELIAGGGANVSSWRPRIEHAQILTLDDLNRMSRLGVIPSVQPTHATSDMSYAQLRLGPERIKGAYAYATQLRESHIGVLPLGSDFPIEGINPLLTFYAAVSRLAPNGQSPHGPDGWFPEQKLSRAEALKGMTLDAAYASFAEQEIGSLRVGKKADFIVLDRDIMNIPTNEILGTRVTATIVDGKVAFGQLHS